MIKFLLAFVFFKKALIASTFIQFTYLDLIDDTIMFDPIFFRNWVERSDLHYSLFTLDESKHQAVPGYEGQRCIIDKEMAEALSSVQAKLLRKGLCLKVYDSYRPQQAVDFFAKWTEQPDTPLSKLYHFPNVNKRDLDPLSYLSRTSSHAKGTAVDVTICPIVKSDNQMPESFLGIWDAESLDMGVGYLCFDEKSWHDYPYLSDEQKGNRKLLLKSMVEEGFVPLDTEFWHYYYKRDRAPFTPFSFPIKDDYVVNEDKLIIFK